MSRKPRSTKTPARADKRPTTTTAQGGLTTKARLWAHTIADHKVAAERELGATRRGTPQA